jgi:hypothetical protein
MGSPGMDDSTTTVGEADLPEFERLYRRVASNPLAIRHDEQVVHGLKQTLVAPQG